MLSPQVIEAIGYLASFLVVLSLSMRSVVRLRIASLCGGLVYTLYGALISSWPIMITNVIVVALNVWNLRREFSPQRDLGAVPIEPSAQFLADFLRTHLDDIRHSQPDFAIDDSHTGFVLMRDGMPAGAVLGNVHGRSFDVQLDYVLPQYRDSRLGAWFYGTRPGSVRALGVDQFTARATTPVHTAYLKSVGFVTDGDVWRRSAGS